MIAIEAEYYYDRTLTQSQIRWCLVKKQNAFFFSSYKV